MPLTFFSFDLPMFFIRVGFLESILVVFLSFVLVSMMARPKAIRYVGVLGVAFLLILYY
jgi:hypothetical protein